MAQNTSTKRFQLQKQQKGCSSLVRHPKNRHFANNPKFNRYLSDKVTDIIREEDFLREPQVGKTTSPILKTLLSKNMIIVTVMHQKTKTWTNEIFFRKELGRFCSQSESYC